MKDQKGQIVIILLLVMVVALAIGLSTVGRSINEISTAAKTEQSSRAFSAAEAGIEKALSFVGGGGIGTTLTIRGLTNQSQAQVDWNASLPKEGTALEYPPFGKESFAQFWLADPSDLAPYYNQNSFELYFGDPTQDYEAAPDNKPAVEVNVIYKDGSDYKSYRVFYDSNPDRLSGNAFNGCTPSSLTAIETNDSGAANRSFYCKATINGYPTSGVTLILARIRLLYTNTSHPVALQPTGSCSGGSTACSIPPQAKIFTSTGTSGDTQRTIQVFQQKSVAPYLFDYALFASGELSK